MLNSEVRLYILALLPVLTYSSLSPNKVVCFYDSRSFFREGTARFLVDDIENSLHACTHLVYGYAKIEENEFKVKSLHPYLDLDEGEGNFRAVTSLKERFPRLKVLLSVGGWADMEGNSDKYMTLLRNFHHQKAFVSSVRHIIRQYDFDGIDLAWQFPFAYPDLMNPMDLTSDNAMSMLTLEESTHDYRVGKHREGFTSLIRQLKSALQYENYLLTVTVLPHINYTLYFEPRIISPDIDGINLFAFDFLTASEYISPYIANYPAPLYPVSEGNPHLSVTFMVSWFINHGMPAHQIVLGIPTYGRAWKLTRNSKTSGVPPLEADGDFIEGQLTHERGILSYFEICVLLQDGYGYKSYLTRASDPMKEYGMYAYRNSDKEQDGIWVGYEDQPTANFKASYAQNRGLGGVAIVDITLDDFKGICHEGRYPILEAARGGVIDY